MRFPSLSSALILPFRAVKVNEKVIVFDIKFVFYMVLTMKKFEITVNSCAFRALGGQFC